MPDLNAPHGGTLCDLVPDAERTAALKREAQGLPSLALTPRQLCDIELILNGGFSPLRGFLNRADYESVVRDMRLADGTLWPMPITLDVSADQAADWSEGDRIALRDQTGLLLGILTVEDVWQPNKTEEAEHVFGAADEAHPAVHYLMHEAGDTYVGGPIDGVALPRHYSFEALRRTPRELRETLEERGVNKVVAFQTRNPMHRAHKELTDRAAEEIGGLLLIHPVVGMTKPGDIDYYTRVRCYQKLLAHYPEGRAMISLLPLAMRMGGPREALWHAIIRKNYGCTHLIVGRDHAGPGKNSQGEPFYGPYDAQDLVVQHQDEIGIEMVPFRLMVYVPEDDAYAPIDEVQAAGKDFEMISGTQLRQKLADGGEIPAWFSYPEIVAELRESHPPRARQGFTVFFSGLSGSGKSTIANALMVKLLEEGSRSVSLFDGDVVRKNLSKGLGFSREDRSTNVQRIGYVASEVTKAGGAAVCAPIAPYESDRRVNRDRIGAHGGYVEVFVDTPLEECERRDVKGLYAMARAGTIKEFTGISDPYEAPTDAEVVLDTLAHSADACAEQIMAYLRQEGYLAA